MKRYKYTFKTHSPGEEPLAEMLDKMGQDGWELCACYTYGVNTRFFFKKEVINSPHEA